MLCLTRHSALSPVLLPTILTTSCALPSRITLSLLRLSLASTRSIRLVAAEARPRQKFAPTARHQGLCPCGLLQAVSAFQPSPLRCDNPHWTGVAGLANSPAGPWGPPKPLEILQRDGVNTSALWHQGGAFTNPSLTHGPNGTLLLAYSAGLVAFTTSHHTSLSSTCRPLRTRKIPSFGKMREAISTSSPTQATHRAIGSTSLPTRSHVMGYHGLPPLSHRTHGTSIGRTALARPSLHVRGLNSFSKRVCQWPW